MMLDILLLIILGFLLIAIFDKNIALHKLHTDLTAVTDKAEGTVKSDLNVILVGLKKHI